MEVKRPNPSGSDDLQSKRLDKLPPYLFVEIDRLKESYVKSGREILDLGIGDPDTGAPSELLHQLKIALDRPELHRYPSDTGLPELKEAILDLIDENQGVRLDEEEVLVTIGSKEAISHLPLAVTDPGDVVLVPDPGYPVYYSSASFAEAEVSRMPLVETRGYWPDFDIIERNISQRARLMYINYPNNPTSAVANRDNFTEALEYCGRNNITLANDAAYSEIYFAEPVDLLFPVARESGVPYIEFFSFSKSLSITGWRIGYAVGSREVISALTRLKANIDSGVFSALQAAVAGVLKKGYRDISKRIISVYGERRDILDRGLRAGGFEFSPPEATFYFWVKTPRGVSSLQFCKTLLEETGIICTPGSGFGESGEGYFRLSLTAGTGIIESASERLASAPAGL